LGGAAAAGDGDDLVGTQRGGGRQRGVNRDPGAYRVGEALLGGLVGGGEPGAGGGGVVVPERGELAPAGITLDQQAVAAGQAAEPGVQVDGGAGGAHGSQDRRGAEATVIRHELGDMASSYRMSVSSAAQRGLQVAGGRTAGGRRAVGTVRRTPVGRGSRSPRPGRTASRGSRQHRPSRRAAR